MQLLSVDHFQSSKLVGCSKKPTILWGLEMVNWQVTQLLKEMQTLGICSIQKINSIIWQWIQVNLFQKLATSAEHVVYQNCPECQNKTKTTICVRNMFCRYSELTIFMKNEQSVLILWINWCKNKSLWQRFTCNLFQ